MRVLKKIILWLFVVVIVAGCAFIAWIYFGPTYYHDPYKLIPKDAIYVIETNNLSEAWSNISSSKMWKHLRTNEKFADINKSANTLDSLIKSNSAIKSMLSDRQLLISAHLISPKDYDFLFIVDLQRGAKIAFLKDYINNLLGLFNYTMTTRKVEGTEVSELHDAKSNKTIYLAFIYNLLLASYNSQILENAIKEKDKDKAGLFSQPKFLAVDSKINNKKMFSLKFNFGVLNNFLNCYLSEPSDMAASMQKSLGYTALNMDLEEGRLSFKGYTSVMDSTPSYFKAMLDVKPGRMNAYEVIPKNAALYLSITFSDFNEFYSKISEQFSRDDKDFESYNKKIQKIEKYLKINLKQDFFSWIGEEIAFVMMKPSGNSDTKEAIVAIQAKNIDDAKAGLDRMMRQIKRRTPAKFQTISHLNHDINLLNVKGFFKLLLGKLFEKIEKPYFTIIEDYVVFSNSPEVLMNYLEQYAKGNILSQDAKFMNFKDNFQQKANVTAFTLMPPMYSWIYYYSSAETKKSVKKNRDYISAFSRVGFQMISDGKLFDTHLITDYEGNASDLDNFENIRSYEKLLFNNELEELKFKPNLTAEQLKENGLEKIKFESGEIQWEYNIQDGKLDGLCKEYYKSGKMKSNIKYINGKADGLALFYFDNDQTKAEINFNKDMMNGRFKEYYEDGKQKAILEYSDGKLDGDIQIFYPNTQLKIEGRYVAGVKEGTWRFYTEAGDVYQRKRFKDGVEKK